MSDFALPVRERVPEQDAPPPTVALHKLPIELLELVTAHLDRPKHVVNLALTCSRLGNFVKLYGWEAFLKGRFGLLRAENAKVTVHGLTTLYRNWDKKAFTARYVVPGEHVTSLNTGEKTAWRGPQGQTMGYQPSVDSYEETYGAWSDRREMLTWSAGTNIVMRVKETGNRALRKMKEQSEREDEAAEVYQRGMFGHAHAWYSYKIPQSVEGRDDITSLKLFRPHQRSGDVNMAQETHSRSDQSEVMVFGTASGRLSMLTANLDQPGISEQLFDTERRPVGSVALSSAAEPLIVASLGDTALGLYSTELKEPSETHIQPLSQVQPIAPGTRLGRIWSSSFVSNDRVALGLGPSYEPIHIYEITPTGFSPSPLRTFDFDSQQPGVSLTNGNMRRNTSVYPIIPISSSSQASSQSHNVFLSGAYDGIVRLHDLRSPNSFDAFFWDVTNDAAIYSLANQGLERFVVGSSMHSMLKVFDLRFPASHAYHRIPIPGPARQTPPSRPSQDYTYNSIVSDMSDTIKPTVGGWNLFLSPRNAPRQRVAGGARHPLRPGARAEDSPVYSLSIPSDTSMYLYAGLEGMVTSLEFASVLDRNPDPVIAPATSFPSHPPPSPSISSSPSSSSSSSSPSSSSPPPARRLQTYDPNNDVLNLGMYEQGSEEGLGMQLLVQDGVGGDLEGEVRTKFARERGVDERWMDPSVEGEKWVRGQQVEDRNVQGQGAGGARRGGRGGRGRGRRGARAG